MSGPVTYVMVMTRTSLVGDNLGGIGTTKQMDASQAKQMPVNKLYWFMLAAFYPAETCVTNPP